MDLDIKWKDDIIYFKNEIRKNIYKFFNNKNILNDVDFNKMLLYLQDYDIYNKIKLNYPLFVFVFLENIIKNVEMYEMLIKFKSVIDVTNLDIAKINLWKYCREENIENFEYSDKIMELEYKKYITNFYNFDKNTVVEMLIFTYYSKKDLLAHYDQEENINNIISIYDYFNKSSLPLFKSSELTHKWTIKIQHLLNYKNEEAGHVWKHSNVFIIPPTHETNKNDVINNFFYILYTNIRNGYVTKNIIMWTYIFANNLINTELLSKLFSIIYESSENMTGFIADLYNQEREDVIDNVTSNFDINNQEYLYKMNDKNIDINFYASLNSETLKLLFEKKFIVDGRPFIDSKLKINLFDMEIFDIFMKYSPFIPEYLLNLLIDNINSKNDNFLNIKDNVSLKKILNNNSLKLINAESMDIKILNKKTIIETININELTDLDIFDKKIIKKYIYNFFINRYYAINESSEDLLNDYREYNIKKNNLKNFLLGITSIDKINDVMNIINNNLNIYSLFFD
jgi:hypothetical protein